MNNSLHISSCSSWNNGQSLINGYPLYIFFGELILVTRCWNPSTYFKSTRISFSAVVEVFNYMFYSDHPLIYHHTQSTLSPFGGLIWRFQLINYLSIKSHNVRSVNWPLSNWRRTDYFPRFLSILLISWNLSRLMVWISWTFQ